jgi:hypothetical protein
MSVFARTWRMYERNQIVFYGQHFMTKKVHISKQEQQTKKEPIV